MARMTWLPPNDDSVQDSLNGPNDHGASDRSNGSSGSDSPGNVEKSEDVSFPAPSLAPDEESAGINNAVLSDEERRRWFATHFDSLFGYCYRLTGHRPDAEDLCQQTFLTAFQHGGDLKEPQAILAWLLVIARRKYWKDSKRKRDNQCVGLASDQEIEDFDDSVDVAVREDWVQAALNQLEPDHRLVIVMYYFEQLSYQAIATALDIPIGTVMSRLSRGKQLLKTALEELALPTRKPK